MLKSYLNFVIAVLVAIQSLLIEVCFAQTISSDSYLVHEISVKEENPNLPSSIFEFIELKNFVPLNYNEDLNYQPIIQRFIKVFASQNDFAGDRLAQVLVQEARNRNLNPCFVVSLLASTYSVDSVAEPKNILELFGQSTRQALSMASLLKFPKVTVGSLNLEVFVAKYIVNYMVLLHEAFVGRSNLIALAWQIGFEELLTRIQNPDLRELKDVELAKLNRAYQAFDLCNANLKTESRIEYEGRAGLSRNANFSWQD